MQNGRGRWTSLEDGKHRNRSCCRNRMCCLVLSPSCFPIACVSLGAALLFVFLYPELLSSVVVKKVEKQVTITPGHATYDQLQNPDQDIYFDVYFLNITNVKNFSEGKEPPKVKEIGPYSFREYRIKFFNESSFSDNCTKLTYTQLKTYEFDALNSASGVSEDDRICTINMAMVSAIAEVLTIKNRSVFRTAVRILKSILESTNAKLYICQPAVDLVFHYNDPLVHELYVNPLLRAVNIYLPTDSVMVIYNASVDDISLPTTIHTGVGDVDQIGKYFQWQNQTELDIWFDDDANKIRGNEGLFQRPNLKDGDTLEMFQDILFRSFSLAQKGHKKIKGLDTFRYVPADWVFQNAFVNSTNSKWGSWCPDGMFYAGARQQPKVPIYVSKPRFMDADPEETTDKIKMLPFDRSKHEVYIYIHPLLGTLLEFQQGLQFNIQVNYTRYFNELQYINGTMYFPIFYVIEHLELSESFKNYIMKQGLLTIEIVIDSSYVCFSLLCLATVVSTFFVVFALYMGLRKESDVITEETNNSLE